VNRNRNLLVLTLAPAFIAVLSCTAGELPLATQLDGDTTAVGMPADTATTTPVDTSTPPPVDTATTTPVDTGTIPPVPVDSSGPDILAGTLLSCRPQAYAVTTMVVGPRGGLIFFGNHVLKILSGALPDTVTITAEQVAGSVNSVRFSPEGLHFAVPAVLSLSYKNCDNIKHWKSIVYTDETLKILEPTLSYDFSNSSHVTGLINHFSRYAVAY
jgi:hypothetical protein